MEVGGEIGLAYILAGSSQCAFTKWTSVIQTAIFVGNLLLGILVLPTCFVGVFPACTLQACLWRLTSKSGLLQVEQPWAGLPLHGILPRTSLTAQLAFKAAAQLQRGSEAHVGSQETPSTALLQLPAYASFGDRAAYCTHAEDGASGAGSLHRLQAADSLTAQVTIQMLFLCIKLLCLTCLVLTTQVVGRGALLAATAKLHQLVKPVDVTRHAF